MDSHEAVSLAGQVALKHSTPAWSLEQVQQYGAAIADLPYELAREAVAAWLRARSEKPEFSDIRVEVARLVLEESGVVVLDADEAWGVVLRWMRRYGRDRQLPQQPSLVRQTALDMGWLSLCESDKLEVVRAQFVKAYEARLRRVLREAAACDGAVSPQLHELQGGEEPPVRLVHDAARPALTPPTRTATLDSLVRAKVPR
jgi:hypothetical protein